LELGISDKQVRLLQLELRVELAVVDDAQRLILIDYLADLLDGHVHRQHQPRQRGANRDVLATGLDDAGPRHGLAEWIPRRLDRRQRLRCLLLPAHNLNDRKGQHARRQDRQHEVAIFEFHDRPHLSLAVRAD